MFKMIFLLQCCLLLNGSLFSNEPLLYRDIDPRLNILKQQVLKDILSATTGGQEVAKLSAAMAENGSWPDIDYTDKTRGGWKVNDHLVRLNSMAVMYKRKGSGWTGNPELEKKIIAGLNYWLQNDFICPNWWYPQIGVPKILAPVMLLLEDKLSPGQKSAGIKILERAKIGMTGQNKVWLSGNVIYRSLLTNDAEAVEAAVKAIQEEIVVSEGEGIQADYSFHQHGTQQQFGNYGAAYASDMLKWATIFQGTAFQFAPEKIVILRNYLLRGMRWITWKHTMDISACGRQLFPNAQSGKANDIQQVYNKMPLVDPAFKDQYLAAMDDFSGNNHFWKSDMTVHRRNNFYASVKMSSRRVGGAESCNDENLQGYHLGDGASYFYQGNKEYTDIFPFWDWKMIPGTTAFHSDEPLPVLPCSGYNIPTDFVGGVTDGTNGVATLAYSRDSLHAQKSWFFFDDAVICLGTDIHADGNKEIRTTVNQSFLHGNVLIKQSAAPALMPVGQHSLDKVSWVLHDGWGYFFPGSVNIHVNNQEQDGDWHRVLKSMPANSIRASLFTVWLNHDAAGKPDKYAYYVFPGATKENIAPRAAALDVVENSAALQVVENTKKKLLGIVFVRPAQANTKTLGKLSADKPCIVMLAINYANLQLSVADPMHQETSIVITVQGNKKCKAAETLYDKATGTTAITILMPQGSEAGKTVNLLVE
ncbi:MAG: polysaccharide lyase family 8 super-sandwich domain-containing protein [Chitinophagaceae bacterium]